MLAQSDFKDKIDLFSNIHDLIKTDKAVQLMPDASSNVDPPTSAVRQKNSTRTNPVSSCEKITPNFTREEKVNTDTL